MSIKIVCIGLSLHTYNKRDLLSLLFNTYACFGWLVAVLRWIGLFYAYILLTFYAYVVFGYFSIILVLDYSCILSAMMLTYSSSGIQNQYAYAYSIQQLYAWES